MHAALKKLTTAPQSTDAEDFAKSQTHLMPNIHGVVQIL